MSDPQPQTSVRAARIKLVALMVLGVLLIAAAPAAPGLVNRYHLGSSWLGNRYEWRMIGLGLMLIVAPTFVLIKFRHEKD